MKTYINIRVVRAEDTEDAWDNVVFQIFEETDLLCDSMIELDEQLREELEKRLNDEQ
jgi:hypothetical protein